MRSRTRWAAASLLIAQTVGVPLASAQQASAAAHASDDGGDLSYERAHALFREGRALMAQGRHQEACESFEQSLSIEEAVGTQFNLAACWESLGRTASAQKLFVKVADATQNLGQKDRARVARERAAALEPRLSRLVVDVQAAVPGIRIHRNEDFVPAAE